MNSRYRQEPRAERENNAKLSGRPAPQSPLPITFPRLLRIMPGNPAGRPAGAWSPHAVSAAANQPTNQPISTPSSPPPRCSLTPTPTFRSFSFGPACPARAQLANFRQGSHPRSPKTDTRRTKTLKKLPACFKLCQTTVFTVFRDYRPNYASKTSRLPEWMALLIPDPVLIGRGVASV